MALSAADEWADFLERRSDGLRRKGILAIAVAGNSASFEAAKPDVADDKNAPETAIDDEEAPSSAWESKASYPNGEVPEIEVDDKLPEILQFGDR